MCENNKNISTENKGNLGRRFLPLLPVLLFILFFTIQNYCYIVRDDNPGGDACFTDGQFPLSIDYHSHITGAGAHALRSRPYPPLVHLMVQPFFLVRGVSFETARLSLVVFWIIFLSAMYGIGYEYGGIYSGITVMALAASSPHILFYSRRYYLDFPQTAITALIFYLILKSDFFRNKKYVTYFAVAMFCAFLIKWSTLFFIVLPVLWFLIPCFIQDGKARKENGLFLLFMVYMFAGVIWYYGNRSSIFFHHLWFGHYLLFILTPALVYLIIIYLTYRKPRANGEKKELPPTVFFSVVIMIFAIIAAPWYFWASSGIKWIMDWHKSLKPDLSYNYGAALQTMKTGFSFLPVLFLAGTVYLFVNRKDLYIKSVNWLNLLFVLSTLPLLTRSYDINRYFLSLIIFLSAAGGIWVADTRRLKPWLTAVITAVSVLSILSWVIAPVNGSIYIDTRGQRLAPAGGISQLGIYASRGPKTIRLNLSPALRLMNVNIREKTINLYKQSQSSKEADSVGDVSASYLWWQAYRASCDSFIEDISEWEKLNNYVIKTEQGNFPKFQNILLAHRYPLDFEPEWTKIAEFLEKFSLSYSSDTYEAGNDLYITVIRLKPDIRYLEMR